MIRVVSDNGFKSVVTTRDVKQGEILLDLKGKGSLQISQPTRTSIRIALGIHIEHPIGACINHSCKPSAEIIGSYVIAAQDLSFGTEVTFDYTVSEKMPLASPFTCHECGMDLMTGLNSPSCLGKTWQ